MLIPKLLTSSVFHQKDSSRGAGKEHALKHRRRGRVHLGTRTWREPMLPAKEFNCTPKTRRAGETPISQWKFHPETRNSFACRFLSVRWGEWNENLSQRRLCSRPDCQTHANQMKPKRGLYGPSYNKPSAWGTWGRASSRCGFRPCYFCPFIRLTQKRNPALNCNELWKDERVRSSKPTGRSAAGRHGEDVNVLVRMRRMRKVSVSVINQKPARLFWINKENQVCLFPFPLRPNPTKQLHFILIQ